MVALLFTDLVGSTELIDRLGRRRSDRGPGRAPPAPAVLRGVIAVVGILAVGRLLWN